MTKSEPACPAATSRYATGCASLSLSPNGPFAMRNVQTITEGQCKKRLFSLQWISASGFQLEPVYLRISVWEPKTLSLSRQMHACFGKVVTAVSTNGWVPTTATTIFQVNVQNVPTPLPNVTLSDLSSYITVVSFLPSLLSKVQKQEARRQEAM